MGLQRTYFCALAWDKNRDDMNLDILVFLISVTPWLT